MELTDKELKAIITLASILQGEVLKDVIGHFLLGKGLSAVNDIIKALPKQLKDEINKKLNE